MLVVMRVDANSAVGTGHVSRCTQIATALKLLNHQVHFVCDNSEGNRIEALRADGFTVHEISINNSVQRTYPSKEVYLHYDWQADAEKTLTALRGLNPSIVVVDHYSLDYRFHSHLRSGFNSKIVCLDDLANRPLECDLLIDQNLYLERKDRYAPLTPSSCQIKIGLEFNTVLLNDHFVKARKLALPRTGVSKKVLIFLGGADLQDVTSKVVEAIAPLIQFQFLVVVGTAYRRDNSLITKFAGCPNLEFKSNINMAEAILKSDLAIGCSGVSGWERAFLGLPTLLTNISDNQTESGDVLTACGAAEFYGTYPDNRVDQISRRLPDIINNQGALVNMSRAGMSLWKDDDISADNKLISSIQALIN